MMAGRPRRTRIYGANYNIGESYYKPALDTLNQKQHGRAQDSSRKLELGSQIESKSVFKKAGTEEHASYDYGTEPSLIKNISFLDDHIDEDIQATLDKIRKVKKSHLHSLDDSNGIFNPNIRKDVEVDRMFKAISDLDEKNFGENCVSNLKKITISQSLEPCTSASVRANATKKRLANIESEISERYEKQTEREKRSANLKKLLFESSDENNKIVKKVSF